MIGKRKRSKDAKLGGYIRKMLWPSRAVSGWVRHVRTQTSWLGQSQLLVCSFIKTKINHVLKVKMILDTSALSNVCLLLFCVYIFLVMCWRVQLNLAYPNYQLVLFDKFWEDWKVCRMLYCYLMLLLDLGFLATFQKLSNLHALLITCVH